MAERVGFEPTLEFPLNTLSKRAPSTTRPSLRRGHFRIACTKKRALLHFLGRPLESLPAACNLSRKMTLGCCDDFPLVIQLDVVVLNFSGETEGEVVALDLPVHQRRFPHHRTVGLARQLVAVHL